MQKIKFNFLPLVVVGLITASSPAHAEGSFFDSLSKKFTDITQEVSDKIKAYYGDGSQPNPNPEITPAQEQAPISIIAQVAPVGPDFSGCKKFLGLMYDPTYERDPKMVAAIYLNAALDFNELNYDAKPSKEEIVERNKCVELALEAGSDPDSNGETKRDDDHYSFSAPAPLVRAVRDNDEVAVKILLEHKANPNVQDSSMGMPMPLMNSALDQSQDIAVDLINAGVDLTTPHLLWIAANSAADRVVDLLIQSKQIPVNQLNTFTDYPDENEGETALDASESGLYSLVTYQKKFAANSKISLQDKMAAANNVLYYNYPLKHQLKMPAEGSLPSIDPDAFMNDLLIHQQNVSNSLKAAGWTCKKENCGIIELSFDEDDAGLEN